MHSLGAETTLTGIWSPNANRAADLAREFDVPALRSFDELMEVSEAVDFAVPPQVQAELATRAALRGRALLLEKPLAATITAAVELVDAIDTAGVASLVFFTKRFQNRTREFLLRASELEESPLAITGRYVHGGFLESGFVEKSARTGWRTDLGVLFDLGPHLLDLADLGAGPIRSVSGTGDPSEALIISTRHEGGAIGEFLLSGRVNTAAPLTDIDVYGHGGHFSYSTGGLDLSEASATARREFALAVREGRPPSVDAHRALYVQRIIDAASRSLQQGTPVLVD